MWPNPQETADLITFTEESLNGNLHFLYSYTVLKSCRSKMNLTQPAITCSKLTIETLEQGVKYVQS